MGIIRTATAEPFVRPQLANTTLTTMTTSTVVAPRAMNANRTVVYGTRGSVLVKSVNDGTTWTTVKDFGSTLAGFWILPNGEALVSTNTSGVGGKVLYSTGFATSDTGATWTQSAGITGGRGNDYVHPYWGLGMAPKGHVREGLVVITKYGPHGTATTTDDEMGRVWISTDYGKTFSIIFKLESRQKLGQHMHGATYDPWDDRVIAAYGDGNGGTGARADVIVCDNFLSEEPTWTPVISSTSASFQLTSILPQPDGILFGGDGTPPGIYRLPRRARRVYGAPQVVLNYGGGTDTGFIGQSMYQHAPGFPVLVGHEFTKAQVGMPASIHAITDGSRRVSEVYRYSPNKDTAQWPTTYAVGPTANGKVVMLVKTYNAPGPSVWSNGVSDWVTA